MVAYEYNKYPMGNSTQNVEKKQTNKEKTEAPKAKTPEKITQANKKSEENLKKNTEKQTKESKKEPVKKKEKNWTASFGTTSARGEAMSSTTTGLKFENKNKTAEITV